MRVHRHGVPPKSSVGGSATRKDQVSTKSDSHGLAGQPQMSPPGGDAIGSEDHECAPNKEETGKSARWHQFMEQQHAEEELQDRGEVLQEAERGEWDSGGSRAEEQQRD